MLVKITYEKISLKILVNHTNHILDNLRLDRLARPKAFISQQLQTTNHLIASLCLEVLTAHGEKNWTNGKRLTYQQ